MLWVLNNLGVLYTREAAHARASDVLDRAHRLARELNDVASLTIVEENRAVLLLAMGSIDEADVCVAHALTLAEQRRDNTRRAASFRLLARVAWARDRVAAPVIGLLERALTLCQLGEDVQLRVEILSDLGDAFRECGEMSRAKDCWRRALELARIAGFEGFVKSLQMRVRSGALNRLLYEPEAMVS